MIRCIHYAFRIVIEGVNLTRVELFMSLCTFVSFVRISCLKFNLLNSQIYLRII